MKEATSYKEIRITGVKINYFFVCKRKLWLFAHYLSMEHTSDYVALGKLLHEKSFQREPKKERLIDNLIRIDFIDSKGVIHDVKSSGMMEKAHTYQILYYLYYLKQKGIKGLTGEINYPKDKRKTQVELDSAKEEEIERLIQEIAMIEQMASPPNAELTNLCKKCSYFELCWS